MAAPANLSFETAGSEPGLAGSWTLSVSASVLAESFARADGGESAFEGFEHGWGADAFVGDIIVPSTALSMMFGPVGQTTTFDGFEHFWTNDGFLFALGGTAAAAFLNHPAAVPPHPTTDAFEPFETEWANDGFLFDLGSSTETDLWNSTLDVAEGFEREWSSNESFAFDFSGTSMIFTEGASHPAAETFEAFVPDQPFGVTLPSTINAPAHGFANGAIVKFFPSLFGASVLPSGLSTKLAYVVAAAATNTFEVTLSGNTVDLVDPGAGQVWVRADPSISWGGLDGDLQAEDP